MSSESLEEFESTLKDLVLAKRLSASKITKLTEITMKCIRRDTQLVSILYRTHKSLPTTAKVSSLYAFDALARAARSQVNKHPTKHDPASEKGNCATFLIKIEGVVEGLFRDMGSCGAAESKEKSTKVLEIWTKAQTFAPSVLTHLSDVLKESEQEIPQSKSPTSIPDPRRPAQTASTTPPSTTPPPAVAATPPALPTAPPATAALTPAPAADQLQSQLLAMLTQAANGGIPPAQAALNSSVDPQLALLQQLALTAQANAAPVDPRLQHQAPSAQAMAPFQQQFPHQHQMQMQMRTGYGGPNQFYGGQLGGPTAPGRGQYFEDRTNTRGTFATRGNGGGFRGRGRGRWEDHSHSDNQGPHRVRNGRSKSPPSRNGGGGGVGLRPNSPPGKPPSTNGGTDVTKDEFGREIRSPSPHNSNMDDIPTQAHPPSAPVTSAATTTSVESAAPLITNKQMSITPHASVAANTSSQTAGVFVPNMLSASASTEPGLDQFDITTFNFTLPSSWESLAKMWKVTFGVVPTQEALMQFIMSGGVMGMGMGMPQNAWGEQMWGGSNLNTVGNFAQGMGMGGMGGNENGMEQNNGQHAGSIGHVTNATIQGHNRLGSMNGGNGNVPETSPATPQISNGEDSQSTNTSGGRMQRVGNRWVFVRDGE